MAEILSGAKIIRIQKINAYTKVLNKIFLNTFLERCGKIPHRASEVVILVNVSCIEG